MIKDRPRSLLDIEHYRNPPVGLVIDWTGVPDLLKLDTLRLSGIQPITGTLAKAAGGVMHDNPSPAEAEIHRANKTTFQLIQVVISVFDVRANDSGFSARPYAITLVPAVKRDAISTCTIDLVEKLDLEANPFAGAMYVGFDPFKRDRGMWGNRAAFDGLSTVNNVYTDELGLVVEGYFLATSYDADDVLMPASGISNADAAKSYKRRQLKAYFRPFTNAEPRRLWGLESPIELFLAQAMARVDLFPQMQTLVLATARHIHRFTTLCLMLISARTRTSLRASTSFFQNKSWQCSMTQPGTIEARRFETATHASTQHFMLLAYARFASTQTLSRETSTKRLR